jgi:hypothetical protein
MTSEIEENNLLFANHHVCRATIVFGSKLYRNMMIYIKCIATLVVNRMCCPSDINICSNPSIHLPSVLWGDLECSCEVLDSECNLTKKNNMESSVDRAIFFNHGVKVNDMSES